MRSWTLDLPYTKPPLTLNQRLHWRSENRLKTELRDAVLTLARQQRIPALPRIAVEVHYAPRDSRHRDPINLALTAKVVEDALVTAGVVPDDTPQWVEPTPCVIDPPSGGPGRVYVVVRELAEAAA